MATVFIFYQTRCHRPFVGKIRQALEDAGFIVWVDEANEIPPSRAAGLDSGLMRGIQAADVILYLVPSELPRLPWRQRVLDGIDTFTSLISREQGSTPHSWHYWLSIRPRQEFYGIDLEKYGDESWQAWEARVGEQLGVPVVSFTVAPEGLRADLERNVIPKLRAAPPKTEPPMTPEGAVRYQALKSLAVGLLLGVAVAALLAALVLVGALILGILWLGWKPVALVVGGVVGVAGVRRLIGRAQSSR